MPRLSAVMLAWRDEPLLVDAVQAVLASQEIDVDVVVVDNGCTSDAVGVLRGLPGVTVIDPGANLGFAGGCNEGARAATGEYVAFVNGDAVVEPDALARMVDLAAEPDVGLVTASVRLYDEPETVNTVGNPVHFTGLSWAGGLGDDAAGHASERDVASASGAATVCRLDRFRELGGFCEEMFAYCEDTDLSLRSWQRGWRVVFTPEAVVRHRYEFSRNPEKFFLLQRNRWFMVLTLYSPAMLVWALPPMIALELATTAIAIRDGWVRHLLRAWVWLLRHPGAIARRRRRARAAVRRPDREVARLLTGDLDPRVPGLQVPAPARAVSRGYWSIARRLV
ncbi:glycosyltransferase family 2 protein [Nocardioides sp. R-C-SC26]|uniref:glycosyltransferase family 2 protein n=1 Tax=Nocardioides sp. R-C-SC26 TaxID=2870414 RepID=UPI001E523417|nr:glycosyltransferase family 2 protein [Nocardioides sp. R-C-SC26]